MWKYLSNQFLNETEKNYKKGLILSNFHDAALQKAKNINPADADIDKMHIRYNPLAQTLANEYAQWKNLGGIKQASTLNVDQLLATLTSKMNIWGPDIEKKFVKTSPEYKAILPNGRTGLAKGSKEDRVNAIKTLSKSLDGIGDLNAVKTEVDNFYTLLDDARKTQLGNKSQQGKGSDAVALAIVACMVMMYRNLGLLMDKHADDTALIETYFDLETLQESLQTSFTGTLDPLENEAVLIHTFMKGDEIRLKIKGNGAARFYLSNTANGVNSEMVQVAASTTGTVIAVDEFLVPDYATYRFLTAVNPSSSETLKYEVEVL